ncbi:hypothetical protein DOTSEDRAFT_42114 [Dothistroma septosporum NZE10]|uniref:U6 small nuclear RNA (adenine-(43)-N(6))-methyltransferase n=1 Tax=Dothistroma septosporum (strain NZE10 / CBS 128990) TaxID=675120 RepID=N1PZG1_DOTSN|nr:hypothetical protein DOTSEDRAFT_42114 [Dothistroma septosporum NZE10]
MRQIPYYDRDVDFDDLAKRDPDFATISQHGKRDGFINFQDTKIVQQLTKSLLKIDFNLSIELPEDKLCPPVPVRWNYVRWAQELLDTTNEQYRESFNPGREIFGLDIGVGASCIYSLLACSTRESWRMAGTDISAESLIWAQKNIEGNELKSRIKLTQVSNDGAVLPFDTLKIEELDLVMTNPPFYSSQSDFESAAKLSEDGKAAPSAVLTGASNEMICPGGDVGFVTRILNESLRLRERVQWYTAMLSKLSSLQQIIAKLKEHGINNFAVTSLHPGHRTKRYAVAWSFGDLRPRNDVARHGELVLSVLPQPTAQTIKVPVRDVKECGQKVNEVMQSLDLRWQWRALLDAGVMECKTNVWSRAARRKKKMATSDAEATDMAVDDPTEKSGDEEPVALAVKITCKDQEVEVRWLRGCEWALFESFCGMLKRSFSDRK